MFDFISSKKGFTLTELLICVVILSIISAVCVPFIDKKQKEQKVRDCDNNCQLISTAIQEAMYGMMDNGKKQESFIKGEESNWMSNSAPSYMFPLNSNKTDCEKQMVLRFKKVNDNDDWYWQIKNHPHIPHSELGDEITVNGKVYRSNYWCSEISYDAKYGLRLGFIRGGYRPATYKDYNEGCNAGYYLKKNALADTFLVEYLANGEVPVCPFDKEGKYHYYVFADGSVLCTCPKCVKAHNG